MTFFGRLEEGIERKDSVVCVGLDPVPSRTPDGVETSEFLRRIIDATSDVAAAYKPNTAYYEAMGDWDLLVDTVEYAGVHAPVVLDAKRADVGHSSRRYAELLDLADAITVNPYMGRDSIQPFLQRSDSGVFVLCRTTNRGGSDFQDLEVDGEPLYVHVAERVSEWNEEGNAGLVVGATYPDDMERVRDAAKDLPFLVPGVGAQDGDVEAAVKQGLNDSGVGLVNSTRSIIYAGEGMDFDSAARTAAKKLRDALNSYR